VKEDYTTGGGSLPSAYFIYRKNVTSETCNTFSIKAVRCNESLEFGEIINKEYKFLFKLINSIHNKSKQSTHLNKIPVSLKSVCISTFFFCF